MIEEYDIVRLIYKSTDFPVPIGITGTVLMIFEDKKMHYLVEFIDNNNVSLGTFIILEEDL